MKALHKFVTDANRWRSVFGHTEYSLDNAADRQKIANKIDSELSPENLTCDGELSRAQVQAKYKHLTAAARELQQLDPSVIFYEFN